MEAGSIAEKRKTADEIVNGFKNVGFIYLEKHGIPDGVVKNAFTKVSLFDPSMKGIHVTGIFDRVQNFFGCPKMSRFVKACR